MKLNDGHRPSRLDLARRLTGETPGEVSAVYRTEIEAEPVEPFDLAVLRAHAARLDDPPARRPRPWLGWFAMPILVAAALVFALVPGPGSRTKGAVDLDFYVLRDGLPRMGDTSVVYQAGDQLQLSYLAGNHDRAVVLSIDGEGRVSRYHPTEPGEAAPVIPGGRHLLDDAIVLDDAPGPEVFLAFFGEWTVPAAEALVRDAWESGRAEGVIGLAEEDPTIAVLVLQKR